MMGVQFLRDRMSQAQQYKKPSRTRVYPFTCTNVRDTYQMDPKAISACNLGYSGSLIIKMYPDNAISACNLGHSGSSLNKSSENVLLNRLSLYKLYVKINTQTTRHPISLTKLINSMLSVIISKLMNSCPYFNLRPI